MEIRDYQEEPIVRTAGLKLWIELFKDYGDSGEDLDLSGDGCRRVADFLIELLHRREHETG